MNDTLSLVETTITRPAPTPVGSHFANAVADRLLDKPQGTVRGIQRNTGGRVQG
jgi:hypothetical protein